MTPKNKFTNYTPYFIIAFLCFLGVIGYIKSHNTIEDLRNKLAKYEGNHEKVEEEFVKINDEYNSMMASLSEKDQLLIESQQELRQTNDELKAVLDKKNKSEQDLEQAKALIAQLKSQISQQNMGDLQAKINRLQEENSVNKEELDYYKGLNKEKSLMVNKFERKISEKEKIIKKGSNLRLGNFEMKGINVKSNGQEEETDQASKTDKMRVEFSVNSNNISESGVKNLYLALYNSEGRLAMFPDAQSGRFRAKNGEYIDFTDHLKFHYKKGNNTPIKFDWENENFEKGEYTIKIYENGVLIGSQSMNFR